MGCSRSECDGKVRDLCTEDCDFPVVYGNLIEWGGTGGIPEYDFRNMKGRDSFPALCYGIVPFPCKAL